MPVDPRAAAITAQLLADLCEYVRRFVVLTPDQLICVALWILHTHTIEAADQTPYLNVRSAEKQSGKTRLLEVLELLCPRAVFWTRPSEAVTFRTIEAAMPTVLLDEIDTIWNEKGGEHEGLRALLNAGNRRGTTIPRCVGPNQTIKQFPVFCAKALAGIGVPPGTVADRSIPIVLKRRTREEKIERFRRRLKAVKEQAPDLRRRAAEWAEASAAQLADAWPELPDELSDRQQDVVEPLLAIADLAGDDWDRSARDALVNVITQVPSDADSSLRLQLLADLRRVFAQRSFPDRVRSADLVADLQLLEDGPWKERDLSQNRMAWLLKPYGVQPKKLRFSAQADDTGRGYELAAFKDAWARYLPAASTDDELEQEPLVPVPEPDAMPDETGAVPVCSSSSSIGDGFKPVAEHWKTYVDGGERVP